MIRQILQPPGWPRPLGYANGIAAEGRQVFISGQIGWNAEQKFASDELGAQVRQALVNVVEVLACAGGRPEQIVRLTWYVTDRAAYLAALPSLGGAYRELFEAHYPAMAVVIVAGLVEERAVVEIEGTAIL